MRTAAASVPAPTAGWNARDALANMKDRDAVRLTNLFPSTATVDLRGGYRVHATSLGTGAVQGLAELAMQDSTRKLIAFANNKIYNATTYDAAATDITAGSAITSNKWQVVNFRNSLIMVNGVDVARQYDGTTVADATYTGTGLTATDLVHVSVYKTRLYFVEKNSASIWYPAVNSLTGACTELDVSGLLQRGGFVQFTGAFTRDVGDSTDDLFVIVSNMGEVLLYSGDYPGAINWVQTGRYLLPIPLGRRAGLSYGGDFLVATEGGLISLSAVVASAEQALPISDKIRDAFRKAATLYKSNFGWQTISYPRGNQLIVNIPISDSSSAEQYVMNSQTGAWTRFTGMRAVSWGLLNEKLYFGGPDGKVYEADYGAADNNADIPVDLKGAFNYLSDDKHVKRLTLGRPLTVSDNSLSFIFNVDVDFQNRAIADTVTTSTGTGSSWDTATWDTADWGSDNIYSNSWYSVNGIGRAVAPRLSGNFRNVSLSISAFDYVYELGGLI